MKKHITEKTALLLLSDCVALGVSFVVALLLGHQAHFTLDLLYNHGLGFATLFFSTLIFFFILDGYCLHKIPQRFAQQALILALGLLASLIVSSFIFYFFREPVPRAVLILFFLNSLALIVFFRYRLNQRMLSLIQWRVLLVGDRPRSVEVAQLISSRAYLRTEVVGYVTEEDGRQALGRLPCLGSFQDVVSIAEERGVDQVIVTVATQDDDLMKIMLACMQKKIKVSEFRRVIEEITGKVPIGHLNDRWLIRELSTLDKRYFWYVKRLCDLLVSGIGFCLALPLLPVIALAIKLDSRGPVFYSQQRMGRRGQPFRAWKLRTMVDGADQNNVHWTTDNDNRITRVGRIIRKSRLDEVPQLLNIFKGDMSLIGPRPEALSLAEMYLREIAYYSERHMVTPGITGWAQINYPYGNSLEDTRQKLMYDFYYIKNRSVVLDLMIFLRTIRIMLTGKGAM